MAQRVKRWQKEIESDGKPVTGMKKKKLRNQSRERVRGKVRGKVTMQMKNGK